jgi:hypothetical protein
MDLKFLILREVSACPRDPKAALFWVVIFLLESLDISKQCIGTYLLFKPLTNEQNCLSLKPIYIRALKKLKKIKALPFPLQIGKWLGAKCL